MSASEIAAQVAAEIVGRRVSVGRALGEQLHRDGFERLRNTHATLTKPPRLLLYVLVCHSNRRLGLERRDTCQHLVEHNPEGVKVATAINRLALSLLGREVGGGAHY